MSLTVPKEALELRERLIEHIKTDNNEEKGSSPLLTFDTKLPLKSLGKVGSAALDIRVNPTTRSSGQVAKLGVNITTSNI